MKMPDKCPYCGDILLTDLRGNSDQFIVKDCNKRVTHSVRFAGYNNQVDEIIVTISFKPLLRASWNFITKKLIVLEGTFEEIMKYKRDENPTVLPYFEPELDNLPKLMQKIRTYLVFS